MDAFTGRIANRKSQYLSRIFLAGVFSIGILAAGNSSTKAAAPCTSGGTKTLLVSGSNQGSATK